MSAVRWIEEERWLRDAVKYVKFPPDRKRVREELYEHMLSRNLEYLEEGFSEIEADQRVCRAMGDPEEVGKALAEVHKPFWGYFLRALRLVTVLVLIFGAVCVLRDSGSQAYSIIQYGEMLRRYEAHTAQWIDQTASARCGDYRLRLRRAGVAGPREEPWPWTRLPEGDTGLISGGGEEVPQLIPAGEHLVLELRAFSLDPFLGEPWFDVHKLSVEDSLGNRYDGFDGFYLAGQNWIFRSDLLIVVKDFDAAAEWAVLTYDSGDRSFRLPIGLKGGDK